MTSFKANTEFYPERIILLSGNGQNVGKTTFACQLIQHLKIQQLKVYAVKISPHFHEMNPPFTIYNDQKFILSLEKEKTTKDTGRMLESGADEVFFLQVLDAHLKAALEYTFSLIPKEVIVVIESGAMRSIIEPALFLFFRKGPTDQLKPRAEDIYPLADRMVLFDGTKFNFDVQKIIVKDQKIQWFD